MANAGEKKFRALSYYDKDDDGEGKEHVIVNCALVVVDGTCYHRGGILRLDDLDDTVFDKDGFLEDMLDDILEGEHKIDIQYSGGIDFDKGDIYNTNAEKRWEAKNEREWEERDRRCTRRRIQIYGPRADDLPLLPIYRALSYTYDKDANDNNTHVRVNCEMVFLKGTEYSRGLVIPLALLLPTSLGQHGMLDDILDGDGMGLTSTAAIDFDTGDTFKTNGRAKWIALREFDREQDSGATPMDLACKYARVYN